MNLDNTLTGMGNVGARAHHQVHDATQKLGKPILDQGAERPHPMGA